MLHISAELRRKARTGCTLISIYELVGNSDGFIAEVNNEIPKAINDELACDGIQVFQVNHKWYLGPLDE